MIIEPARLLADEIRPDTSFFELLKPGREFSAILRDTLQQSPEDVKRIPQLRSFVQQLTQHMSMGKRHSRSVRRRAELVDVELA